MSVLNEFEIGLRDKLIKQLNLHDIDPNIILRESTFFGEGSTLGLDSIDALEIDYMAEKEYNIKILASERNETTFANFGAFADFIKNNINRDLQKN